VLRYPALRVDGHTGSYQSRLNSLENKLLIIIIGWAMRAKPLRLPLKMGIFTNKVNCRQKPYFSE